MSKYFAKGVSYHVQQNLERRTVMRWLKPNWVTMWPPAAFGIFCRDKTRAIQELRAFRQYENEYQARLIRYNAVEDETGKTVGVVWGTMKVEDE